MDSTKLTFESLHSIEILSKTGLNRIKDRYFRKVRKNTNVILSTPLDVNAQT